MPRDHFIPQVHLRNFYWRPPDSGMFGIRKRDLHKFPCWSEDVCRVPDGSTNAYLVEQRAVEEFLRSIEPKYNRSVEMLRSGNIDREAVYVIAGFIAYVATCSPAAMRIHAAPLQGMVETTINILDEQGKLGTLPDASGPKSASELLAEGSVEVDVNPKYPQAIGITNILRLTSRIGNAKWDILINNETASPFFTSDFPVAIERTPDLRVVNRIVPLAPDLALRVRPDLGQERSPDFEFPRFACRRTSVRGAGVSEINRLIVQSAESLVFFRNDLPWVTRFVGRYQHCRIEPTVARLPTAGGYLVMTQLKLRDHGAA